MVRLKQFLVDYVKVSKTLCACLTCLLCSNVIYCVQTVIKKNNDTEKGDFITCWQWKTLQIKVCKEPQTTSCICSLTFWSTLCSTENSSVLNLPAASFLKMWSLVSLAKDPCRWECCSVSLVVFVPVLPLWWPTWGLRVLQMWAKLPAAGTTPRWLRWRWSALFRRAMVFVYCSTRLRDTKTWLLWRHVVARICIPRLANKQRIVGLFMTGLK